MCYSAGARHCGCDGYHAPRHSLCDVFNVVFLRESVIVVYVIFCVVHKGLEHLVILHQSARQRREACLARDQREVARLAVESTGVSGSDWPTPLLSLNGWRAKRDLCRANFVLLARL